MIVLITLLIAFLSTTTAQQWPAQITPMNAMGQRLSSPPIQSNTFPLSALGGQGAFPMGSFSSMGFPQQPQQQQQRIFGGMGMMGMPPMMNPSSGGSQPFFPMMQGQQQGFQPGPFGGNMGQGFQQHPRQFGQRQFQPMTSFQQNSAPQQQQEVSVKEASGGSLPKFLEGAPEETITEFKRIIRQPNVTYDAKMKEVEQLVGNLDEAHQTLYRQFMAESDKTQQSKRDAIHKTVEEMSNDAQNQFTKISAILQNPSLPEEERWNKILTIYGSLDPKLRNEFEEKFKPLV